MEIEKEDDLLIQSYIVFSFLAELNNNNFVNSEYFEKMNFEDTNVKTLIPKIGLGNQGMFLISFYVLLVIPRQILKHRFPDDFDKINDLIKKIKTDVSTTYKSEITSGKIDYLYHIRNSVSHARVEFIPNDSVIFSDEKDNKKEKFQVKIPLNSIGKVITELQKLFVKYYDSLNK